MENISLGKKNEKKTKTKKNLFLRLCGKELLTGRNAFSRAGKKEPVRARTREKRARTGKNTFLPARDWFSPGELCS
jgi:hypothetical protein